MPHFTTPPKTPPPKTKYVPLEPMKPKTQKQLEEEDAAMEAADTLFAVGKGGLQDSRWASPQYYKRVQPAPVKPAPVKPAPVKPAALNATKSLSTNQFLHNAAKAGIKIGTSPAAVSALNTPPTTPPQADFPGWASTFDSEGLRTTTDGRIVITEDKDGGVSIENHPEYFEDPSTPPERKVEAQIEVVLQQVASVRSASASALASASTVPPHLRGIEIAAAPSSSAAGQAPAEYVPPHPQHLRSASASPPTPTLVQPQTQRVVVVPSQGQTAALLSSQSKAATPPPSRAAVASQHQPEQVQQLGYVLPHLQHLQPRCKLARPQPQNQSVVPSQGQSVAVSSQSPPRGVVASQPQRVQPPGYVPPHLQHLQPGYKSVQPPGYVPPHLQHHKSAGPSPAPQTKVVRPSQAQYIPPHLRYRQPAIPAASKPVQPQTQSVVLSQDQSIPPHLRRVSAQVSPLQHMAIHQTAPHLRAISSNQTSQLPTTQVHNNTPSHEIVGTTMAPAFYPPRQMDDGQDDFLKWLGQKKPTKKVGVAEKVTIKSEEPLNPVRSPQVAPVRSPKVSPSKESVNSQWSQESFNNINNTDPFLKHMQTKPVSKHYGVPPKPSKSPKHASPSNGWQAPPNAFDNARWKLNEDSVANFETYIKSGVTASLATPTAKGNTVHGSAFVRAAKIQAAQVMASTVQHPHQKPTFNGAQKLGQNPSQPKQFVQKGPAQLVENKKPAAQASVKIENVVPGLSLNKVAPKPVAHADATPLKAAEWQGMPNMQSVAAMISSDINKVQPQSASNAPPLTNEALVLTTGFKTVNQNNCSDDRISSTGLGGVSSDYAQDPRHTQGNEMVNHFIDWDGSRIPVPADWENERPSFDDSFIPEYIKAWQKTLPSGQFKVDINDDKFTSGVYPINNVTFVDPIHQGPDTIPDIAENTNDQELKRQYQTADIEANNYIVAVEKKQLQEKRAAKASNMRHRQIAEKEEEPNPFSPAIDMYMRPAEEKDATGVVAIYNWYISNSTTPEDQEPIGEEDSKWLIKQARDDKLPFLVAIKGRQPTDVDAQGRSSPKIMLPACEQVIGFCFPERYNYGFTGKSHGRSRGTLNLQLYVHDEYARKGVGRNLLDRLIHCLTPGYAYKNAAAWINPSNDKLYETEGAGLFHQLLFQIPVEHKHDPNIAWLTKFLLKFLFKENVFKEGDKEHPKRLKSVCRSSTKGRTAHFLDLAIFHYEARQEGEFDPYM